MTPVAFETATIAADDDFIQKFLSRIPEATATSFSEEQLTAVKMAFGGRAWGAHAIDIRRSLPFFGLRFYLVWLMGWEHRNPERIAALRQNHPLFRLGNAIGMVVFFGVLLLALLGLLYALKTALGIDVFPGIDMLPDEAIQGLFQ